MAELFAAPDLMDARASTATTVQAPGECALRCSFGDFRARERSACAAAGQEDAYGAGSPVTSGGDWGVGPEPGAHRRLVGAGFLARQGSRLRSMERAW